jgi:hypothetical protein
MRLSARLLEAHDGRAFDALATEERVGVHLLRGGEASAGKGAASGEAL